MRLNSMWALPVVIAAGIIPALAAAPETAPQELPAGVTQAMIDQGKTVFNGDGLCSSCHGEDGVGTPIAPNLADATWLHVDGSYPALVTLVKEGVTTPKESMIAMLPKGGSAITDAQVDAVAAYVWKLSHGG